MNDIHLHWKYCIAKIIQTLSNTVIEASSVIANKTPDLSKGDIAFPMFPYAKLCAKSPVELAEIVKTKLLETVDTKETGTNIRIEALGPYINVYLDRAITSEAVILHCLEALENYGKSELLNKQRIMIEFSAPNTNKPLHLGHLRNDAIGESVSRILERAGALVRKVNLINDRGVHICKSMLAYKKFAKGETPETRGIKSDHFVGLYYVKYAEWEAEWKASAQSNVQSNVRISSETEGTETQSPEAQAKAMLKLWEEGDSETLALWKNMNKWAIEGIFQSYKDTGVSFDAVYYESKTYTLGKDRILQGLRDGHVTQSKDGTVFLNLEEINLDSKVLLRADGTSVYITQDIGTAEMRYEEWNFDKMIYVVAHEQDYHFKVLFYALEKLGFTPALEKKMYHLGYGMVNLPEGRMKSREGTVVDADTLLEEMAELVKQGIVERNRENEIDDIEQVSTQIALGAIHYYLLGTNLKKDITFNPQTSLQFNGNTGPYLQYTCARIWTMLEKYPLPESNIVWDEAVSDDEWQIITHIERFTSVIEQAAEKYDPAHLANYLYELSGKYSTFYQNMPIATAPSPSLQHARMLISKAVLQVLKNGLYLLNIPFIQKM